MRIMPAVLHAPWCDPGQHADHGDRDQWCSTSVWTYETVATTANDPDLISISVERYMVEEDGAWSERPARVLIECPDDGFAVLLPHELNIVMQRMLQAQAVANGDAVAW